MPRDIAANDTTAVPSRYTDPSDDGLLFNAPFPYDLCELRSAGYSDDAIDKLRAQHREDTADLDARRVARILTDYVNSMGHDSTRLGKALTRQHRSLQTGVMETFLNWALHLSVLPPGQYDLRNEFIVELSRSLSDALHTNPHVFIKDNAVKLPFI